MGEQTWLAEFAEWLVFMLVDGGHIVGEQIVVAVPPSRYGKTLHFASPASRRSTLCWVAFRPGWARGHVRHRLPARIARALAPGAGADAGHLRDAAPEARRRLGGHADAPHGAVGRVGCVPPPAGPGVRPGRGAGALALLRRQRRAQAGGVGAGGLSGTRHHGAGAAPWCRSLSS